jgi:hypothetical protein
MNDQGGQPSPEASRDPDETVLSTLAEAEERTMTG